MTIARIGQEFSAFDPGHSGSIAALSGGRFVIASDDQHSIHARVFDAAGTPITGDMTVSSNGDPNQTRASVAELPNGGFIVGWASDQGGNENNLHARFYGADGQAAGNEFAVFNGVRFGGSSSFSVTALPTGRSVAMWSDSDISRGLAWAREINPDGSVGGVISVDSIGGIQPSVVGLADGHWVAAWWQPYSIPSAYWNLAGSGRGPYFRIFDADGNALGTRISTGTYSPSDDENTSLAALPQGGFALAWAARVIGGSQAHLRILDQSGNATHADTIIDAAYHPVVTALADGRFAVAWLGTGIQAQVFAGDGSPADNEFRVDTSSEFHSGSPLSIEALTNGSFVVTWSAYPNDHSTDVVRTAVFDPTKMDGTAQADTLKGGNFDDVINGGGGADTMVGGLGDDWYFVDNAGDAVTEAVGEGAADRVFASVTYALAPGSEIEKLSTTNHDGTDAINVTGNELAQAIYGNAGANVLDGKGGADTLVGLGGDDQYYVDNALDQVIEAAGAGNDRVLAAVSYALAPGQRIEILSTADNFGTAALDLTGNEFTNAIYGNAGPNVLDGKAGDDSLNGFGGDDRYFVDSANDVVNESLGGGFDRVLAGVSYSLKAGQEIELLTTAFEPGTTPITLVGNALGNIIVGNAGSNALKGGFGSDALLGLGGQDAFVFNTALDGVGNVDRVVDFHSGEDLIVLASWIFAGLAPGALAPEAFRTGPAAADADDRIIYDGTTGALSYDPDGVNGAGATLFAKLDHAPALASTDFLVA